MSGPAEGPRDDPTAAWREDAARASAAAAGRCLELAAFEALFELDASDRLSAEASWERAFGEPPPTEPALAELEARIHPAHRIAWAHALAAHRAAPHPLALELSLRHADRGWRRHRCRAESWRGPDGRARRTFLAFLDVSETMQAMESEAALRGRVATLERELEALRTRPAPSPRLPAPKRAPPPSPAAPDTSRLRATLGRALQALDPRGPLDLSPLRRALDAGRGAARGLAAPSEEQSRDIDRLFEEVEALHEDLSLSALNAQLEALRLGTQGSGLAAVAGHMKRLARATARVTEELAGRLRETRAADAARNRAYVRLQKALDGAQAWSREHEGARSSETELRAALREAERLVTATDDPLGDREPPPALEAAAIR